MKKIIFLIAFAFLFFGCQEDFERIIECEYSVRIINDTTYSIDVAVGPNTFNAIAPATTTSYITSHYQYDEKINRTGYVKILPVYINEAGLIRINRGSVSFICAEPKKYTIKITYDFYSGSYIYFISEVN